MAESMRVAAVQINSRHDKAANLDRAEALIDEAAAGGARVVALPEYATFLGPKEDHGAVAEKIPGETTARLADRAREHEIYVLGGSMHESSTTPGMYYNSSVLLGPDGSILARYRKIHLFDIDITSNVSANESATILPGNEIVTAEIDGHVAGLSVCYDLRFPEIYRLQAVRGAEILFVPAAFTMFTGKDHWHVLLRARAIENQAYVIAPAQFGRHEPGNTQCYGHSIIVDPWGTVLADAPDKEGVIYADLDFEYQQKLRRQLPSLANRRPAAYEDRALIAD